MSRASRLWATIAMVGLCSATTWSGISSLAGAHADPLASARARAAALTRQVTKLNTDAEIASQRYDAIEARLGAAVTSSLTADRLASKARAQIAAAQRRVDERVQALYASAGSFSLLAVMLDGPADQAVEQAQMSQSFLRSEAQAVTKDQSIASATHVVASKKSLSAQQTVKLQQAAATEKTKVLTLLARQRVELRNATATVKRLAAQQERTTTAAAAAAFVTALHQQGGSFDTRTTPPNAIVATAIAAAKSRIGDPYVWGGTGPNDFDCSGLTQWSYAHAGIELPRVANEQWFAGPHPSLTALEPGDLLFYATDLNDEATIHHVTMYLGDGMMIAAPETGENVQIQPVYMDGLFGATRPWAKQN